MDRPRHDLLARPGRPFEEDRRRGFEDAARQIDHPPDRVAPPEQVREPDGLALPAAEVAVLGRQPLVGGAELVHQSGVLPPEAVVLAAQMRGLDGPLERETQVSAVEGLRDVAVDPSDVQRLDERVDVGVAGENDRDQVGTHVERMLDQLEPRHVRHALIRHQHRDVLVRQDPERLAAPVRDPDGEIAVVVQLQGVEQRALVVDEENRILPMVERALHRSTRHCTGRARCNTGPSTRCQDRSMFPRDGMSRCDATNAPRAVP